MSPALHMLYVCLHERVCIEDLGLEEVNMLCFPHCKSSNLMSGLHFEGKGKVCDSTSFIPCMWAPPPVYIVDPSSSYQGLLMMMNVPCVLIGSTVLLAFWQGC